MAKPQAPSPKLTKPARTPGDLQQVPAANVDILKTTLGLDVVNQGPDMLQAAVVAQKRSMSASPYTSADMLQDYVSAGFGDLVPKIIKSIDDQASHRQKLEELATLRSERRYDRAQLGAQILSVLSLLASLYAGFRGVSPWVCAIGIVVSIGGPNAATILARLLDRTP